MDDFHDDPVYGRLELKRGDGLGGYEGIYRKWLKGPQKYVWHAKYRRPPRPQQERPADCRW